MPESTMGDERESTAFSTAMPAWGHNSHIYPHSHHGTPTHEYSGFNFMSPDLPMDPSAFNTVGHHRPSYPHLIMPQWPSMLQHQTHQPSFQSVSSHPVQPVLQTPTNTLPTPVSATSAKSASTPRKTLTDQDRRRMCQYAEDNPQSKQTEIGAIFGVERSTVSKVLRQKEKYLQHDEGSQSPVRRAKGRSPDVERALAVWARNQERKGFPLSDDMIRDKACAFATTTTPEHQAALSASWIEKFKLKNNLMGARSRKESLAPEDADNTSSTASVSHTPGGTSPISPLGIAISPRDLHGARSHESLGDHSPEPALKYLHSEGAFHSQNTASLNTTFTDVATSSFSPGPLSPLSPFFTPDSGTAPSPFAAQSLNGRPALLPVTTGQNNQRPRSQTFPLLDMYTASSGDMMTPKFTPMGMLDASMEAPRDSVISMSDMILQPKPENHISTIHPSETMRPPPLPAHCSTPDMRRELSHMSSNGSLHGSTSPEDAHRAMEVVWSYFRQQPDGSLNPEELFLLGKLMQKVELHSRAG